MKAASSSVGATRVRCPEGCSTMASATGPNGLASQRPSTRRVPEVVPMPAMWPVNALVVTSAPSRRRSPTETSDHRTEPEQRDPRLDVVEDADHGEPDAQLVEVVHDQRGGHA